MEITNSDILTVNVVSIIISALIVRIIYSTLVTFQIMAEEASDERPSKRYRRTAYYIANWLLVSGVCLFVCILIYEFYKQMV